MARDHSRIRLFLRRALLFAIACVAFTILLEAACEVALRPFAPDDPVGEDLNRLAWEASFTERGLIPANPEPREGYWGSRIQPYRQVPYLHWQLDRRSVEGRFASNESGVQIFGPETAPVRILVLGASVAQGAYASSMESTWIDQLRRRLLVDGCTAVFHVFAAGAWKSDQEAIAWLLHGSELAPTLVIVVNGSNDLTLGAPRVPFGWSAPGAAKEQEPKPFDFSIEWRSLVPDQFKRSAIWKTARAIGGGGSRSKAQPPAHVSGLQERTFRYLGNMSRLASMIGADHVPVIVVLQPTLSLKPNMTGIERRVSSLEGGPQWHEEIRKGYAAMRSGLSEIEERGAIRFVDGSNWLSGQSATTFADICHFTDPAHQIFAERLAPEVLHVLRQGAKRAR
jgi:hypothetical protein